jgi:hypothetical protein
MSLPVCAIGSRRKSPLSTRKSRSATREIKDLEQRNEAALARSTKLQDVKTQLDAASEKLAEIGSLAVDD